MKLKMYTPGNAGFVSKEIADLVGKAPGRRQAHILIYAQGKAFAAALASDCGIHVNARSPEFRVATGNYYDALHYAGVLRAGTIYVMDDTRSSTPVVAVARGEEPEVIGQLQAKFGTLPVFIPAGDANA